MAHSKQIGRIAQVFLVLWFASLTSCGSVMVVVEAGSLGGPLGLPWTHGLVTRDPFVFLWIYLALLLGIAACLAPGIWRGEPILRDATFLETFLYVMMLAITAVVIVFSIVLPTLVLEWVLGQFIPEAAALPLSAAIVIPLFLWLRRLRLAKVRGRRAGEAGTRPAPSLEAGAPSPGPREGAHPQEGKGGMLRRIKKLRGRGRRR